MPLGCQTVSVVSLLGSAWNRLLCLRERSIGRSERKWLKYPRDSQGKSLTRSPQTYLYNLAAYEMRALCGFCKAWQRTGWHRGLQKEPFATLET